MMDMWDETETMAISISGVADEATKEKYDAHMRNHEMLPLLRMPVYLAENETWNPLQTKEIYFGIDIKTSRTLYVRPCGDLSQNSLRISTGVGILPSGFDDKLKLWVENFSNSKFHGKVEDCYFELIAPDGSRLPPKERNFVTSWPIPLNTGSQTPPR